MFVSSEYSDGDFNNELVFATLRFLVPCLG